MDLMSGDVLSKSDLRELGWDVKDTVEMEEFEPVMVYPVVAYHGSLQSLWGLYYISNSRDSSGLVLEALGAAVMAEDRPPTLRRVSRSSITMTGKFINLDTGEIR